MLGTRGNAYLCVFFCCTPNWRNWQGSQPSPINVTTTPTHKKITVKYTHVSGFIRAFVGSVEREDLVLVLVISIHLTLVYFQIRYVYVQRDDAFQTEIET